MKETLIKTTIIKDGKIGINYEYIIEDEIYRVPAEPPKEGEEGVLRYTRLTKKRKRKKN